MRMDTEAKTAPIAGFSKPILNAEEVAGHIGMTPKWIYEETRRGRIPHMKLGRYYRYRATAIDSWLRELEEEPVATVRRMGPARQLSRGASILDQEGARDVLAA
jgi:excisionase family DNA binding protein